MAPGQEANGDNLDINLTYPGYFLNYLPYSNFECPV